MRVKDFLYSKKAAIWKKWLNGILDTYPKDTSAFLKQEKNQFANPVGQTLFTETAAILDLFLGEMDPDKICGHLEKIIKIRAIQDFSPARAVSFVLLLKHAMREELKNELKDANNSRDFIEIESKVDQLMLFAFDVYTKCREKFFELRVNELKRNIAGLLRRTNLTIDDLENSSVE